MKVELLGSSTKEEIERRLQIVAATAKISRSERTVTQVFESCYDYQKNLKLIKNVLGYGHKSIAEHDYLVFALENISMIMEQMIIGYRLTSFTIKSRRNVDFSNVGFYVPEFRDANGKILKNNIQLQMQYSKHMKGAFKLYKTWNAEKLPIEDCRYIIPHGSNSNLFMGCNVHELLNMTVDLLLSDITEAKELGGYFSNIIQEKIPYLEDSLKQELEKEYNEDHLVFLDQLINPEQISNQLLDKVEMTDYTENGDQKVLLSVLMERYQCNMKEAEKILFHLREHDGIKRKIMQGVLANKHQRELEQVLYSYQFPISLANLTHITRHRMHSLLVPEFTSFHLENYVTPETISENHLEEYNDFYNSNKQMKEQFEAQGVHPNDLIYFLLSGNACNVTTTMNARELKWISQMRCCEKAQWEIRGIANQMVELASNVTPLIGEGLGPTCKVLKKCYEGKDNCHKKRYHYLKK